MSWNPQGNIIAFIGTKADRSDLYIYDLGLKKLTPMTNDVFSDQNPTWSLDGKTVFFTSDRGDYIQPNKIPADFKIWEYDYSGSDYYGIDINSREMTRYSNSKDSKEGYVQISADGKKILYVSDLNGISNIYLRERDSTGKVTDRPITNSMNPIDQISMSRDGKKLLFVSLNKGGYDIFSIDNPFERKVDMERLTPTEYVMDMKDYALKFGREFDSTTFTSQSTGLQDSKFLKDSTLSANTDQIEQDSIADDFVVSDAVKSEEERENENAKFYGEDVKVDLGQTTVKPPDNLSAPKSLENPNFSFLDNVNPDGSFKIKKYKVKFTPDLVYGNAAYTSFYGFQGLAQIALSDLLGDHRIVIQTSMVIDLKNSDYAVGYYYLPKRTDFGLYLFHTARFVSYGVTPFNSFLYRYRTIGGTLSASYPISRFKRIDAQLTGEYITQENLDYTLEPSESKTLFIPSFSLIHDNTVYGYTSPVSGTRYNFTLMASPKLGQDGIGFGSLLGDLRTYLKLGDGYTFVTRVTGGASFGPNPQRFFIGGMANWINYDYENTTIPIEDIQDFAFSSPGLPLRGFNYDRLSGSKYAILNAELRFPLLRYLVFGALPLGFANVEGVAFVDAGTAWSDNLELTKKLPDGREVTKDLLLGTGLGARINLLGFPFMFDVAWSYNMQKFSAPKYYISLGYNF
ncbi:MAG: PD40 domain-containing protein [Ignavibacteria bacterium]|nr:PD40 domain-containing protein [Ignavibacteria bacterium]